MFFDFIVFLIYFNIELFFMSVYFSIELYMYDDDILAELKKINYL
jgi:hypothetical protein